MFHKPNYTRYRQPIHGFTLVELLVVISIIALLLGILMPSLQKAREQAKRVVCLSNQRQNSISLHTYANDWEDKLPPMDPTIGGTNASLNFFLRLAGRWQGLGRLYTVGLIEEPKHLYCPAQSRSKVFSYPEAWEDFSLIENSRACGYVYRIFDQKWEPLIPSDEVEKLNTLKFSNIKGQMALTSDLIGPTIWWDRLITDRDVWYHRAPLGVNAAYADGHAEFVRVDDGEYERGIRSIHKYGFYGPDYYTFLFFKALDDKDFSELEDKIP